MPLNPSDKKDLCDLLSYEFRDDSILTEALSHRSFSVAKDLPSNQRLEFLGDAVIELISAHTLFEEYPDKEEGPLTEARASLVKGSNLASVAKDLGLGKYILLSPEENSRNGRENPSILADLFEAIVGAIYLDGGFNAVKKFVERTLFDDLDSAFQDAKRANYKSRLLEYVQASSLGAVKYIVVDQKGPDHSKTFEVEATLNGTTLGRGIGKRLKNAEQLAAREALESVAKIEDQKKDPLSSES